MDFDFSEDQVALRDAVQRWARADYAFERRRTIVAAGGFSAQAWQELAGLGLTGLMVPAAHGGMGMEALDAMVVMEELGRQLVLEPYAQAALCAPLALGWADPALQARWLPRIASGEALVVPAMHERERRYRWDAPATLARRDGAGWRLSGRKSLVAAGDAAHAFVVAAREESGDGLALFLVERHGSVVCNPYRLQDGSRAAEVTLRDAPATLLVPAPTSLSCLSLLRDLGIAAMAAEAVGAMEQLLAMTVEYLRTRRQFGAPLASFQALRHRAADCRIQLELARSMSYYAHMSLGAPEPQRRAAVSRAKVQLGQSARFLGQQCVQMHGGIGVTDEYPGSHYFKRLTCMELSLGDTSEHLAYLSAHLQPDAGVLA